MSLDTTKKRNAFKQLAVIAVKRMATFTDRAIANLSAFEWRHFKTRKSGTAQYLVFRKTQAPIT